MQIVPVKERRDHSSLKLSKCLVSVAQDSVLHWAAHAQLERLRSELDDARKVYQTALLSLPQTSACRYCGTIGRENQGDQSNTARENMTMARLVMLYRYGIIVESLMLPIVLRERASIALGAFPGNSIILGIFIKGKKGQGIWGKPRGMLGDNEVDVGKTKDVAHRVEVGSTRSGLARAVESERCVFTGVLSV